MKTKKKILSVRFEGVLCQEENSNPVKGSIMWLYTVLTSNEFKVYIDSCLSRSKVKQWLRTHFLFAGLHPLIVDKVNFSVFSRKAWLSIDDRVFLFEGIFPPMEFVRMFKSYHQKSS